VIGDGGATAMTPALATTLTDVEHHLTRWETLKSILASIPLISPVDYYHLASGFGKRRDPFTNRWALHSGLDLAGWLKAPVYSTAPGTIVFSGKKERYGKMVEIDHGNGIRTRYGHLFKVMVRKGEKIGHRYKVGLLGSTGRSTGPHVHYEVLFNGKQLDPLKFIKAGRHVFKSP
jgi:murein DD-endopeptidase MepM/ murein hydrolase activator NlpD